MKRKMKQLLTIVLSTAMMPAMTVTAFAAEVPQSATVEVEISDDALLKKHTFKAYQIFSGTQATDESGEINPSNLGDVEWGSGIDETDLLSELNQITNEQNPLYYDGNFASAQDVANFLNGKDDKSDIAKAFAKLAYQHIKENAGTAISESTTTELLVGYYLIVDVTDNVGESGAYNTALLQLTGKDEIKIELKTDAPEVVKKVTENEKAVFNQGDKFTYGDKENDVADYCIGDDVPFSFYSKVPDMSEYDEYKYVFHDYMSDGLTLDETSVVVTIGGKILTKEMDYTINTNPSHDDQTKCSFEITISDLKKIVAAEEGAIIKVTYNATLNANAEIGLDGNPNTVYLEYSNNPNEKNETGKTPEDTVIVFTYELDVDKVDGDTLENGKVDEEKTEHLKNAQFVLYRLVEAGENGTPEGAETETVGAQTYYKEYVKVDNDNKVTDWKTAKADASTLTSDADGLFKVIGLDDGTYYLEETKAPAGYNLLKDPIKVVVTATTTNNAEWTNGQASSALTNLSVTSKVGNAAEVDGTVNTNKGTATIVVANNKGVTLPETGSVGTTLLYVVGILAMAGGVFYFTMNRKKKENES